jgi:hypothetical protein
LATRKFYPFCFLIGYRNFVLHFYWLQEFSYDSTSNNFTPIILQKSNQKLIIINIMSFTYTYGKAPKKPSHDRRSLTPTRTRLPGDNAKQELREGYKYFKSFYGNDGLYSNPHLAKVNFATFCKAWTQYKRAWNARENIKKKDNSMDSIDREIMRDRLLIQLGQPHIGYICSPDTQGIFGVEDLVEEKPEEKKA